MIGERIEGRAGFPLVALLCLLLALGSAVLAGVLWNPHPAIFAVLPLAVGLGLLLARQRPFEAILTEEGLEIATPELSLPWDAIEGVDLPGKLGRPRTAIQLFHPHGVVHIPARISMRSDRLFEFLLEQIPPSGSGGLPGPLAKYRAAQEARFGPVSVFSYCARPRLFSNRLWGAFTVSIAVGLAGLIQVGAGFFLPKESRELWIGLGALSAIISAFGALLFFFDKPAPRVKNWEQSGLVISPTGLALVQGDLCGELGWEELRDIRFRPGGSSNFTWSGDGSLRGIHLIVAGATIVIADLYDRPLSLIYQQLRGYWSGKKEH
jgi:hypothetical protein